MYNEKMKNEKAENDAHTDPQKLAEAVYNDASKLDRRNEIQEEYASHPVPWFEWVFDRLDLPPASRVLELGGGSGTLWQKNRARIPTGWKIIVTDLSLAMTRTAQENLEGEQNSFTFSALEGQALPFGSDCFDAVLAIGVLDHVPDLRTALSEIRRVLRPEGRLLASAGGRHHLKEMESLLSPYLSEPEAIGGKEERFGLENGQALLAPYFAEITRRDYRASLTFDAAQPILDYLFSETEITAPLAPEQVGALVNSIKRQVAGQNVFQATVEKGLFTARKGSTAR